MLKYTGYQTACDGAFGVFLVAWFVTRHGILTRIIYSVFRERNTINEFGSVNHVIL